MISEQQRRQAEQEALANLNKFFGNIFGGRQRSTYRYYASNNKTNKSRTLDRYFYTVGRVEHNGRPMFVSGVYRYNATTKRWTARMKAGHAKKRDAMARAYKLQKENK